jgi:hypothetical protein
MQLAQSFGESWEDQQRRWAGAKAGKAPATGPKTVDDFSEIEEADGGVHGDRYGYAGARQPTQKSTQGGSFPQGPWPASSDASRDSTSSVGSEARASSRWGLSLSRARSLSLSSLSLACSLSLSLSLSLSRARSLSFALSLSLSVSLALSLSRSLALKRPLLWPTGSFRSFSACVLTCP